LGTRENGVIKYNIAHKKMVSIDYSAFSKTGVNAMGPGTRNNLFVGTIDNKLLEFNGRRFKEIFLEKKSHPFVNSIITGRNKTWFTTSSGCYYLKGDSVNKISGIDEIAVGAVPVERDETLVGSTNGIFVVDANDKARKISVPQLRDVEVRCLNRFQNFVLVGTSDEGIWFWDMHTGKVYHCDIRNGLFDNQVFSILVDSKNNIWAGTGSGIQMVLFNANNFQFEVKKFSKADGYQNSESNLNAIAEDKYGAIWFGTTNGAFVFNKDTSFKNNVGPYVVIQNATSTAFTPGSAAKSNVSPWYHFPVSPTLPYSKNNISFTAKGIFMREPESIAYSYQLVGYDTAFSPRVSQTFFNYQSLEPGKYIFRIKAFTAGGQLSANIAEYPFSVATPFYKTKWFLLLVMAALVVTGILIQALINGLKQKRQKQLELVRQEEQKKMRQRTSEDFHDELGNKLTRISLLADILQKKVGQSDIEKSNIIQQVKENVQELYMGTKDVIWSLSPSSDNLLEILKHIRQFGDELFQDSEIDFSFTGLDEVDANIKLPGDYSRNIIMIFKEILNNSLRHSQASKISMAAKKVNNSEFLISQSDNGVGINKNNFIKGNGLNNIQRRAERIGAVIETASNENDGTRTLLKIKIPLNGG